MHKISTFLWGLVLIAVGVIWGINVTGIAHIDVFFPGWWTLFIIVPCFIDLFNMRTTSKVGDLIGIGIGLCLMLGCMDIFDIVMVWKLIVPAVLVIAGLAVIMHGLIGRRVAEKVKELHKDGDNEYWATFSGQNIDFAKQNFENCTLEAVFGGVKCDLRHAKIAKEASIQASSVFGGITIYVPEDVKVEITATQIFGGVSDKRKYFADKTKSTLYISANCIFGGVEIKNA